ncbi:uncharacterized protein DS421_15g491890 [Arachis hypogaea]|nr:uncharacterized protein DS421_15g491890 [Arachis hypogaea]
MKPFAQWIHRRVKEVNQNKGSGTCHWRLEHLPQPPNHPSNHHHLLLPLLLPLLHRHLLLLCF